MNDIDPGTAKRSRKPSKSDRKRRKVGIFTSDVCLFYAEMNHHLNLFNTFFFYSNGISNRSRNQAGHIHQQ